MANFLISEDEIFKLKGEASILFQIYIYLRIHMDFSSGIVGKSRGISYQSIAEFIYIEPRPGVRTTQSSKDSIRRAVARLQQIGLLSRVGSKDFLIFRMPFAKQDNSARKKAASGAPPYCDTTKAAPLLDGRDEAAMGVLAQAATPPVSGNSILSISSSIEPSYTSKPQTDDDDEKLIFHRSLHQDTQSALRKMLKGFGHEVKQELLDELSGYINLNRIRASPEGLMLAMIKSYKAGGFQSTMAHKVRLSRVKTKSEPLAVKKTPEQQQKSIEAAKLGLATVHEILGRKRR